MKILLSNLISRSFAIAQDDNKNSSGDGSVTGDGDRGRGDGGDRGRFYCHLS
ncbi:MAG: hypothetical protein ACOX6X_06020 [Dethiobacteria bacterium]